MNLSEPEILQALMKSRTRLSASAWVVVRDTHAAEDIFQNVALKAMTREVSFESEGALLSWAFITARHEEIDWLRRLSPPANCSGSGTSMATPARKWRTIWGTA